jgi:hypothetical protein
MKGSDQQNRVPPRFVNLFPDPILEFDRLTKTCQCAVSHSRGSYSKHYLRRLSDQMAKLIASKSRKSRHKHMLALQDEEDLPNQNRSPSLKLTCSALHPLNHLHNLHLLELPPLLVQL